MNLSTVILAGLLGSILVTAIVYAVIARAGRRRRQAENLSAIDFARGSFASQLNRGVEMGELLLQLVEALRDALLARDELVGDAILDVIRSAPAEPEVVVLG